MFIATNEKKMKKILSIAISAVLAVGLVAGLSGCGDKASKTGETAQTQSEQVAECRDFILTADKVLTDYFSAEANPDLNITESVGSYKGNEVVVFPKHNFKIVENRNNYFYTRNALQSEMYRRGNIIFDNYVGYVKDAKHNDKKDLKITETSTFEIVAKDVLKEKYSLDVAEIKKYYANSDAEKDYIYVLVSLSSTEKTSSTYSVVFELEVSNNNGNNVYYVNNEYLIKDGSFDFEQTKVVRPVSLIENYNNAYVAREMDLIRSQNNVAPVNTQPVETNETTGETTSEE